MDPRTDLRRIVREEIFHADYENHLRRAILGISPPVTREQVSDMIDGKIGNFSLNVPALVRDEAGKFLISSTGVSEMLNTHRTRVNEDLRTHQNQVAATIRSNLTDLEKLHEKQMSQTQKSMQEASQQMVNKMLRSDEGNTIVKGVENKLRGDQNMMFYGGIIASLAAGILGGFIGANMRRND